MTTKGIDYYKYFIYRHIRLDTNEVFYIGRGKAYTRLRRTKNSRTHGYVERYYRAYCKANRNVFWDRIVAKTEFEVEIIFEADDIQLIFEKEIEFISLYGRRDLGKGTLVNLSDGGPGPSGMSAESIAKLISSQTGTGLYQRLREERSLGIAIYNTKGEFITYCKDKYECAKVIKCSPHTINNYIKYKQSLNDCLLSREYNEQGIDATQYVIYRPHSSRIQQINIQGEIVGVFEGIKAAAAKTQYPIISIARSVKSGKRVCGMLWQKAPLMDKINQYVI